MPPVVNLSNGSDFDPLKVTDLVASELLSFPNVTVVPVNLTLATLTRIGKPRVETPQDAVLLARELGADGTVVCAVTEYRPYTPPVVGLVLQYYPAAADRGALPSSFDPVAASRSARPTEDELAASREGAQVLQVQRVFNAADNDTVDEIEDFAHQRRGDQSPYAARKYVVSQELYLRFCCWSAIRTMLEQGPRGSASGAAN